MKQRKEFGSQLKSTGDNVQAKAQTNKPAHTITTGREAPPASGFAQERHRLIAEAAYYRAQARGFAPGGEMDDWIQAEAEIDHVLARA